MISIKGWHCKIVYGVLEAIPNLAETAAVSCHPRGVKAALRAATRAAKLALSALLGYS